MVIEKRFQIFISDSYYGSNSKNSYMQPRQRAFSSIGQSVAIFTSQDYSEGSYGKKQANAQHLDDIFDFAQCKIDSDCAE